MFVLVQLSWYFCFYVQPSLLNGRTINILINPLNSIKLKCYKNKNQHNTHETHVKTHTQNPGSSLCKLKSSTIFIFIFIIIIYLFMQANRKYINNAQKEGTPRYTQCIQHASKGEIRGRGNQEGSSTNYGYIKTQNQSNFLATKKTLICTYMCCMFMILKPKISLIWQQNHKLNL